MSCVLDSLRRSIYTSRQSLRRHNLEMAKAALLKKHRPLIESVAEIMLVFSAFDELWPQMDPLVRQNAAQHLAREVSQRLGLPSCPDVVFSDTGPRQQLGLYSHARHAVMLKPRLLEDPWRLMEAIAHELWHAYQWHRIERAETPEDKHYLRCLTHYIQPIPIVGAGPPLFQSAYEEQYVESEANAFSSIVTGLESISE